MTNPVMNEDGEYPKLCRSIQCIPVFHFTCKSHFPIELLLASYECEAPDNDFEKKRHRELM